EASCAPMGPVLDQLGAFSISQPRKPTVRQHQFRGSAKSLE
ncbi:6497_t:CDS:1, partial [Acaulospora morrowiae]